MDRLLRDLRKAVVKAVFDFSQSNDLPIDIDIDGDTVITVDRNRYNQYVYGEARLTVKVESSEDRSDDERNY